MPPLDGSKTDSQWLGKSIGDLQWAHETLVRITEIVLTNGLLTERLSECVVQLQRAVVLLEGLIQEHLKYARRRSDDAT
jgi:hypothetical protein